MDVYAANEGFDDEWTVVETSGESHARQFRDAIEADGDAVERLN